MIQIVLHSFGPLFYHFHSDIQPALGQDLKLSDKTSLHLTLISVRISVLLQGNPQYLVGVDIVLKYHFPQVDVLHRMMVTGKTEIASCAVEFRRFKCCSECVLITYIRCLHSADEQICRIKTLAGIG